MQRDTELLSTDWDDFCFIDTETLSKLNVKDVGVYPHIREGRVVIVSYAIGEGPVKLWHVDSFDEAGRLKWADAPKDLQQFLMRARFALHGIKGRDIKPCWFVAWNAAFDRISLSRGIDMPPDAVGGDIIEIPMMIDAMAQAVKSHLPPDLTGASQYAGLGVLKQPGKHLIKKFADANSWCTPQTNPEEWKEYLSYAHDDITSMRAIFMSTVQLDREEWREYWANEAINDRGIPLDVGFVTKAAELAELNAELANADVARISKGKLRTVNQHKAILDWVLDKIGHLPETERILTQEIEITEDDDGNDIANAKMSLERARVVDLIAMLERLNEDEGLTDDEFDALEMLRVREFGASATPKKFIKALGMLDGGRVKGQYVFNGANATGRFSSRGLQVHNLTRSVVETVEKTNLSPADLEIEAIETIAFSEDARETYAALKKRFGPVGRTLSRLIRPAITAPEGFTFGWADWSAVEARGLPWLADSDLADEVLDVFIETDNDPSLPDIYKRQAGSILHKPPLEVTKAERQSHGKVPVLSLGFGGGTGALHAMARNYGVAFTEDEAKAVVKGWREANPWAKHYWDDSWEAVLRALDNPETECKAGRVTYVFVPDYRKGTLFGILPDGRALLYPSIRFERRDVKNKFTGEIETKVQLTYRRGRARAVIWYGTLVENATQGICGSLLRWVIREYEETWPGLLTFHTHDEIGLMARVDEVAVAAERLSKLMSTGPSWVAGFPLAAVADVHDWYTKTLD
jgi:DNA polymerase